MTAFEDHLLLMLAVQLSCLFLPKVLLISLATCCLSKVTYCWFCFPLLLLVWNFPNKKKNYKIQDSYSYLYLFLLSLDYLNLLDLIQANPSVTVTTATAILANSAIQNHISFRNLDFDYRHSHYYFHKNCRDVIHLLLFYYSPCLTSIALANYYYNSRSYHYRANYLHCNYNSYQRNSQICSTCPYLPLPCCCYCFQDSKSFH